MNTIKLNLQDHSFSELERFVIVQVLGASPFDHLECIVKQADQSTSNRFQKKRKDKSMFEIKLRRDTS